MKRGTFTNFIDGVYNSIEISIYELFMYDVTRWL